VDVYRGLCYNGNPNVQVYSTNTGPIIVNFVQVNVHVANFSVAAEQEKFVIINREESWLMESSHSQNVEEDMIPYSQVLECVELDFYKI